MRKTGYHEITGLIHCLSGLRVGGSDELLQIGGTDLTCIKHPVTLKPYIPGSSIKGKMRSEQEQKLGKFGGLDNSEPCGCAQADCLVCRVFGPHKKAKHELGPTRIVVRDAASTRGGETELKSENVIDRKTGTALHPRKVERVVAGSEFSLRIGIQVWDRDEKADYDNLNKAKKTGGMALVAFVLDGLKLVQRTGLGSGVSKGSGEVQFDDLKLDGQSIPEDLW
ncbi:MAG: type III-A CRISPR-associated RAMP protein Csm3 [Gemmataceae bacterium]|nr:type III-A CRISPR-associated RAMP protein Csm3 [Gemmataceae bacterium]MCI0739526.1 type III-A CRISPR-associated RAMP protein Csm3 [Gemmataceae bacterium]